MQHTVFCIQMYQVNKMYCVTHSLSTRDREKHFGKQMLRLVPETVFITVRVLSK